MNNAIQERQFEKLYNEAWEAGRAAAETCIPPTMLLQNARGLTDGYDHSRPPDYVVPEGPCGFAWVKIRPATSPFARWLKKTGKVRDAAWNGGYDLWIGAYDQSVARKEAHAYAMAQVLQNAGIKAYAQSRLD